MNTFRLHCAPTQAVEMAGDAIIEWRGEHKGIRWEIGNWGRGRDDQYDRSPTGHWNSYILVDRAQCARVDWPKFWLKTSGSWDRSAGFKALRMDYSNSLLGGLRWHGGVTWYSRHEDFDTAPRRRWIKCGCDYGHSFDQGMPYTFEEVQRDLFRVIDELVERVTFKIKCPWNGSHFDAADGVEYGGCMYSPTGAAQRAESDAKASGASQ